ncbi:bacillithiol biosynthesis deacetylase BshB2 [Deinococcus humi]|uniref:Bacillithiol biosynthesis deacetylase BshB2 n=1 Tax=Deinococcus humi TaxID=662880 RepID=A0A7W8JV22_9DEIO|nr:bacillithiol biosynthesis deacetylase BshB2 [Deinococcus humi]MBB5363726.1 bacillithiol biosynthesis deacetylase BshB2 [Deinococcus humi]GGO29606.1 bacillithiol biosynthesis deacetylase BshB2 [Deinococcus humi]
MSKQPILMVFPHPDDETFALGGLLALHAAEGTPVTYLCATRGEAGRNMGQPLRANRETLPDIREAELREACAVLGIDDLRLLGFRDRMLEFENPDDLARPVLEALRELRPWRVYTYYPEHGYHPDHDAMSWAVVQAMQQLPSEERPVLLGTVFSEAALAALGEPDLVVPTAAYGETVRAAFGAHRTQTAADIARVEARMAADEAFRAQVEENRRNMAVKLWIYPLETNGVRGEREQQQRQDLHPVP